MTKSVSSSGWRGVRYVTTALSIAAILLARSSPAQSALPPGNRNPRLTGPLIVSTAGSLAGSLADLVTRLVRTNPGLVPKQSSAGSVDAARQAMDSATVPDVLAVADAAIIPRLLMPRHTSWYASAASNAMVIAYTDRSAHANEMTAENWMRVLLEPGVRSGHSDPALDPGGYRARLVFQLAERHYRTPGLAAKLDAAVPTVTPAPGDNLVAMLERGALDYLVVYRTTVLERGLRSVALPNAVNLSDSARARDYAAAHIRVATPGRADSLEIRGEPIVYGVTIPTRARHPDAAAALVRLLLSAEGQAVLRRHGFTVPARPSVVGTVPAGVRLEQRQPSADRSGPPRRRRLASTRRQYTGVRS